MLTEKRLLYAGAIELAGAVRGLWLAGLGWDVTGYDMANDALSVARANAARAGVGELVDGAGAADELSSGPAVHL